MSPPISALEAVFQAASDKVGFPIDQVRYIILLFLSYPIAFVFYRLFSPKHTSVATRHVFSTAVGVAMGCICFGWQMLLLFGFIGVSYLLLHLVPPAAIQHYTMVWAMGCISVSHLYRLLTDFGGYTLDFTGPLMVHVQKVTLVAYALHDGLARKESNLNDDQKANMIHERPSVLEYLSYMFNFHSFLAGPSCTIREYLCFMDGSNLQPPVNPNQFANAREHATPPSPLYPGVSKLFYALLCLGVMMFFSQYYTFDSVIDPQLMTTIPNKLLTLYFVCLLIRSRYYFIWQLTDSINNAAGLGFSGYDEFGKPKWDIVTNCKILDIELGLNIRSYVGGWNCTTSKWIRRVIYERVKFFDPNMASFVVSAWWHGFYPNYYLMFIYMGIANEAGRKMRRLVRPLFQSNLAMKRSYDVITHVVSEIFIDYGCAPFVLLWLHKGLALWSAFYYIPLIIICVIAFLFPSGKREKKERPEKPAADSQQSPQQKTEKAD